MLPLIRYSMWLLQTPNIPAELSVSVVSPALDDINNVTYVFVRRHGARFVRRDG